MRQTPLEEALRLITIGVVIFAPVVLLHILAVPNLVSDAITTPRKGVGWPESRLRVAGILAATSILGGALVALLAAWDFKRRNPVRNTESVWDSLYDPDPRGTVVVCDLTLETGEVVTGVIHTVDSVPAGSARDIALKAPFRVTRPDGTASEHAEGIAILSENVIASAIVRYRSGVSDELPTSRWNRARVAIAHRIWPEPRPARP